MKMEYRLLCDNTGVILTRQAELISGELLIQFTGAPEGSTAIFERDDGHSLYRPINDENCSVDEDFLHGTIKVTVVVLNGSVKPPKWLCEGIRAIGVKNAGVIISPDDVNLQEKLIKLQMNYADVSVKADKNEREIKELREKLEKLLEGYDIT